ncbi:unnamed protein product [Spirodela intermedia]|uniref:Uncharacterized protein n=1 Tax=Spirodela intermedia TaxID=51605 RepID=A0A7I8JCR8_SPIIN|nr:unnamed protein product [Spirodela intermedia]CAA6667964.1 unnamed protein product [Spirodela intermedia]
MSPCELANNLGQQFLQEHTTRKDGYSSSEAFVVCLSSKNRGFGPEPVKKNKNARTKEDISTSSDPSKPKDTLSDRQFMERLEAVKRSALEQKKIEEEKFTQEIDYDAPIDSGQKSVGIGMKVGVGIAVVIFGLVFALGDFLPSGSVKTDDQSVVDEKILSEEEKERLQKKLRDYQVILSGSPNDLSALEGAAVTSAELGEFGQASNLLEKLTKEKTKDPDAFRLLGEVKYALKDYEGSVAAYRDSFSASETINFEILRGYTNSLLAAKKPDEAVQVLLSCRDRLKSGSTNVITSDVVDPIQVDLLLGKAYSDWGHVSDAVSVYDQLISTYPNDFRGYLAKGIILKQNGNVGDAERMFIQARFFAPRNIKALVDGYSRR